MSLLKTLLEIADDQLDEGKMSEIDAGIRELFKNKDIVKIEEPSVYTYKNNQGDRKFVVYGVVFTEKPRSHREKYGHQKKQEYQDYVYHAVDSTDVKKGLPKKLGGDILSVKK